MKKVLLAVGAALAGVLAFAGPAGATAPTPPEPTTFMSDVLAAYGDKLMSVITAAATNTWVLALFGVGIAAVIVRKVVFRGAGKVTKAVG